jgi:hypothetical protein
MLHLHENEIATIRFAVLVVIKVPGASSRGSRRRLRWSRPDRPFPELVEDRVAQNRRARRVVDEVSENSNGQAGALAQGLPGISDRSDRFDLRLVGTIQENSSGPEEWFDVIRAVSKRAPYDVRGAALPTKTKGTEL